MIPQSVVDIIKYITVAGVFVVLVMHPDLLVKGIGLVTSTLSGVLSMGK